MFTFYVLCRRCRCHLHAFSSIGRQGVRHSVVQQIFVHRSRRKSTLPKNRVIINFYVLVLSLISRFASRTKEITNDLRTQYFFLSLRFFNYCSNKLTKNGWDYRRFKFVFSSMLTFKSWVERAAITNATLPSSFRAIDWQNTKAKTEI